MEVDKEFGIKWPNATSNTVIPAVCPEGTGMHNINLLNYFYLAYMYDELHAGFASRRCSSSGRWEVADVRNCSRFVYQILKEQVDHY